ncbi:DUF2637 domain-containing protein [Nonomuraea dietziae]|uniref:DUF2637 domain-containing protein n=1 Tax=Nonomuraea dietziae TaxID=65515 RepID=UPI0033C6DF6E
MKNDRRSPDIAPERTDEQPRDTLPVKRRNRRPLAWLKRISRPKKRASEARLRTTSAPPRTAAPSLGGDRFIRGAAVIVLLLVAGAAAYVSYHHFFNLALGLGERRDMALLYPAMSDGVIVMASLVMVYCSRRGLPVPLLAKAALILGGAVTLAANVAHGWDGGTGSRLLSALAPIAFVGAYELLMWLIRSAQVDVEPETVERIVYRDREVPVEVVRVERVLPRDRYEAALWDYEESLREGNRKVGRRALANRWGITEREADALRDDVNKEHADDGPSSGGQEEREEPESSRPELVYETPVRWGDRLGDLSEALR